MPGDPTDQTPPGAHDHFFENAVAIEPGSHSAILQLLNREVGGVRFPVDKFESTAETWDGIPIIYALDHPKFDAYDADSAAELARLNGRVVGQVTNARVERTGHPRLMGDLDFGGDPEVEQLCKQGVLSLSTAFYGRVDSGDLVTPPRPHHVLIFKEDARNRPVDPGAMILNKVIPTDAITNAKFSGKTAGKLRALYDSLVGATGPLGELLGVDGAVSPAAPAPEPVAAAVEPTPAPVAPVAPVAVANKENDMDKQEFERELQLAQKATAERDAMIANKDAVIAERDVAIANKDSRIAELEGELALVHANAKDAQFEQFLQKIRPAFYEKAEDKAALRTEFDSNPVALMMKMDTMLIAAAAAGETGETGKPATPIANSTSGYTTVGSFNPATGGYE